MFRTSWFHTQGDSCIRSTVCFICTGVSNLMCLEHTRTHSLAPCQILRRHFPLRRSSTQRRIFLDKLLSHKFRSLHTATTYHQTLSLISPCLSFATEVTHSAAKVPKSSRSSSIYMQPISTAVPIHNPNVRIYESNSYSLCYPVVSVV